MQVMKRLNLKLSSIVYRFFLFIPKCKTSQMNKFLYSSNVYTRGYYKYVVIVQILFCRIHILQDVNFYSLTNTKTKQILKKHEMRIATIHSHSCRGNVSVRTTYVVRFVCGVPPAAVFAFPMLRCTAPKEWTQRVAADSKQRTGCAAEGWVVLGLPVVAASCTTTTLLRHLHGHCVVSYTV